MSTLASWGRLVLLVSVAVGLCACTASKDITQAQRKLRKVKDFREVEMKAVAKPLSKYRKKEEDQVLFHLEHGMLEHFQQDWDPSSTHFRQAQRAIEENYTKSINRNLQSMLVNDLQLPYRGEAYEDVYLNAVKCLNYLHQSDREGAMVEARKVTHDLEMLSDRYKGLAESVQRDTAQTAVKKVDEKLENVDLLSGDEEEGPIEIQQNSALGRFLTMVLYAKRGQRDDARIERRKLRTALEDQGHTEFLDALSQGAAAAEGSATEPATGQGKPTTSLLLRASPGTRGPPPPLQLRVDGRILQTLDSTDLGSEAGRYSVRLTDVPAETGDSIVVRSTTTLGRSVPVEVWSDSARYRGTLNAGDAHMAFVLGDPESRVSKDRAEARGSARETEWVDETPLQPARMTYAHTRRTARTTRHFKVNRTLRPVGGTDTPAWRVVEHVESVFGNGEADPVRSDTMRLSHPSLSLLRYSHQTGRGGQLHVRQEEGIFLEAASRWHRQPTRVERATAAYGEGAGVHLALATRALSVGETISLPVYMSGQQAVRTVEAHVASTDSVTTPAGAFSVYEVQIRPPSPHQGTTTLYLRSAMPHHLVQARTALPIQQNGRPDTLTLKRTLTHRESLSTAVSAPAVAEGNRIGAEAPVDPPTLAVADSQAVPRSGISSTGLVPSSQQLTEPDTYNTLLVSFGGRAPKKKERSFTFNFTIRDEDYQLNFAIPLLKLPESEIDRVRAIAAGDTVRVPMIEDLQKVAHAMFEEKKSIIYTRAVIRAFLKAAATKGVEKLAESQGGAGMGWLAKQAGQMASASVAEADTRGWQTMPGFAYATVAQLPAGTHEVTFEYLSDEDVVLKRRTRQIEVAGARDLALAESIYLE